MAGYKKKPATKKPTYNKAKTARKAFKPKTANYKTDHQSAVCCSFIDRIDSITHADSGAVGSLANLAPVTDTNVIEIAACIPLSSSAPLFASHRHATLTQMFNEWNTSAVYLDLLFSAELRKNCDQVFILVERAVTGVITSEAQMVSDVNCRMYQLGDNTQKLTFKHIFNTAQDKINKRSKDTTVDPNTTYFLKILCKGKSSSKEDLAIGDCAIKIRAKMYNKYRDMKALSAGLN
jgi:hypothetical protein